MRRILLSLRLMEARVVHFIIVIVFVTTCSIFTIPYHALGNLDFDKVPTYETLNNEAERIRHQDYLHFPGWRNFILIIDGKLQEYYAFMVTSDNFDKNLPIHKMKWLEIRSFDLMPDFIRHRKEDQFAVPFVISIKYEENTDEVFSSLIQGTLNVSGEILVSFKQGRVLGIMLKHYYDSYWREQMARTFLLNESFNGEFALRIVPPFLQDYLSENEHFLILEQLVEAYVLPPLN